METDDRQVTLQQLRCVRDSFAAHFHAGASLTSHTSIGPAYVEVGWTSLKSHVDAITVGRDTLHAVRLHYGLKTSSPPHDYRFSIGVELLRMVHLTGDEWRLLPVSNEFYAVDAGSQLQKTSMAGWADDEVYFEHTFIRRTSDAKFEQADHAIDTRSIVFPWEDELLRLYDDNDGCDSLRFICVAEPAVRQGDEDRDMRHHICAVALARGSELISDDPVDPVDPFKKKAADVGCPCPSLCAEAAPFPAHGTGLRNCK